MRASVFLIALVGGAGLALFHAGCGSSSDGGAGAGGDSGGGGGAQAGAGGDGGGDAGSGGTAGSTAGSAGSGAGAGGSGGGAGGSGGGAGGSGGAAGSGGGVAGSGGGAGGGGPVCGNGQVEGGEGCDDMDGDANDGCAGCQVSAGWVCGGEPSACSTTVLRVLNSTSFPLISLLIDGVEQINGCNIGVLQGTAYTAFVLPNQSHTWSAHNGLYDTSIPACPKVFHESWGPASFTQPAVTFEQELVNRSLHAYVNDDAGYTYSCWEGTYTDGVNTRVARLRLNDDGSWRFVEIYNVNGQVTRQGYGTSWNETSRTLDFKLSYNLVAAAVTWAARYDLSGGHYIWNGADAVAGTATTQILYLRQYNGATGQPLNCPPP